MPSLLPYHGVYCWLNRANGKRYVGSAAKMTLKERRAKKGKGWTLARRLAQLMRKFR